MRCVTAKRTCGGYDQDARIRIHQYDQGKKPEKSVFHSIIPRKCSLPVREPVKGTESMPKDSRPIEVNEEKSNEYALRAFFYEYRLVSNQDASRGFLSNLEHTLHQLGPRSNLAEACRLVAGATYGIKLRRPYITFQAYQKYHELLAALALAIHNSESGIRRDESILVAMLLGLYEVIFFLHLTYRPHVIKLASAETVQIIVADSLRPGYHDAHAGGVAAMLRIKNSPLSLLQAIQNGNLFFSQQTLQV